MIPCDPTHFAKTEFWEKFSLSLGEKNFEWYADFNDIFPILIKYISKSDKVLEVGCGKSNLSSSLYKNGFHNIWCIDNSEDVTKFWKSNENIKFEKMDVTKMKFAENFFDLVLDKGTIDALAEDKTVLFKMWNEIFRVLKRTSKYICITLAQRHILQQIAVYFAHINKNSNIYKLVTHCINKPNELFPIFVMCFYINKDPQTTKSFIVFENADSDMYTFNHFHEVMNWIMYKQAVHGQSYIQHNEKSLDDSNNKETEFEVYRDAQEQNYRFKFFLWNNRNFEGEEANQFAVFIVPIGRESEWLFAHTQGRKQLFEAISYKRVIIVHLNRNNHDYGDLDAIKAELSSYINAYRPDDLDPEYMIPFLSTGKDTYPRRLVAQGTLQLYPDINYIIEDIQINCPNDDNDKNTNVGWVRQLFYTCNPSVIQSEIHLKYDTTISQFMPDFASPLTFEHHKAMITLCLIQYFKDKIVSKNGSCETSSFTILLIGLGGGVLASYLKRLLPECVIEACDIEPTTKDIATKYFGLNLNDIHVDICDGLRKLERISTNNKIRYDCILLDANSYDASLGLTSPPTEFLEKSSLKLLDMCRKPSGVIITTLLTRDNDEKRRALTKLSRFFDNNYMMQEYDLGEAILNTIIEISAISLPTSSDLETIYNDYIVHLIKSCMSESNNVEDFVLGYDVLSNAKMLNK